MTALQVRDLTVRAGERAVLEGVGFEVDPGEVVAVIGPNGAGKTTLLEAIVGARPSPPSVLLGGHAIRSFRDRARSFSFSPDDASPPAEALVSSLVGHAHAHRPRNAALLTGLRRDLQLEPILERPAGALSRGERRRVLLYVALAADRPLVVLDEPFAPFDPLQLRDVVRAVRAVAETGAGILVSIHQLGLAERIADRVLLLSEGRRVAFGPVASVLRDADGAPSLEEAFVRLLTTREETAHAS